MDKPVDYIRIVVDLPDVLKLINKKALDISHEKKRRYIPKLSPAVFEAVEGNGWCRYSIDGRDADITYNRIEK